ncbi:STAS domain-containing protein [Kineosporia babensis]|uniref:Anti-sigma factor antagonist n=1 Tax=Kineosporia babensis TaxID=499548 RepID=A0A9X1NDS7_9ACTN|nr:STAS domain-containing protein [Kineosporia babensis]
MDGNTEKAGPRRARHLRSVDVLTGELGGGSTGEAAPGRGDVSVYHQEDTVVVLMRGAIDINQAQELEEAGSYAIEQDLPILVDVRHVDMIDSVGISFLVRVAASIRAHGGTVTLSGPAPVVEELLTVAGASSLFRWSEGRISPDGKATP